MSKGTLSINFEGVLSNSGDIQKLNKQLRETLDDIQKTVVNLENSWDSEGSTAIREKMKAMDTRFSSYEEVVNQYIKFLRESVASYKNVEAKITKSASLFN